MNNIPPHLDHERWTGDGGVRRLDDPVIERQNTPLNGLNYFMQLMDHNPEFVTANAIREFIQRAGHIAENNVEN